jgi:hypothetical protein
MEEVDQIRFSRRAEAHRVAQEIKEREIRVNRDTLGIVKATQHASEIASKWLREQYEAIERDLPN